MNRKRREFVAHHEAAHAVIARLLGASCPAIVMFPTDEHGTAGAFTTSPAFFAGNTTQERVDGIKAEIKIKLAGPLANVRYSGKPNKLSDGAKDDLRVAQSRAVQAVCLLSGYDLPPREENVTVYVSAEEMQRADALLGVLRAETEKLVFEHWPKIQRVAQALLTADMLVEADLDRLIAAGGAQPCRHSRGS